LAAARLGKRTLVLSLNLRDVASMPCNPSIGGPAKGHIVREIDALGGEMAVNIDATCMQVRTLNTGKGPAVQTVRAHAARFASSRPMLAGWHSQPTIVLRAARVAQVLTQGGRVQGVLTQKGEKFLARAVIITTGTYMTSRIHIGTVNFWSGNRGEKTSN